LLTVLLHERGTITPVLIPDGLCDINAAKIGLVVITLERYFKVVHAVLHRKHYRPWMTRVGVAVPWVSGFCTFVIPAAVTIIDVPGQCPRMGKWPFEDYQKVSGKVHVHCSEHAL